MCSERIQQRIGFIETSQSFSKRGKKSFKETLLIVVKELRNNRPLMREFVNEARAVLRLIDAWSKHRVVSELERIVHAMHHLSQTSAWERFVASIPSLDFQRSQLDKLVRDVLKIAKYWKISKYLHRTATKYPITRAIRVVVIDLPAEAFDRASLGGHVINLDTTFEPVRIKKYDLAKVCSHLGISSNQAISSFSDVTRRTLEESGVHAEVQLLLYCDRQLHGLKPRVICSSKKACFLCNMAIKTHGKIFTPYCHGRLYPGWRLPNTQDHTFASRLNASLRESSRTSLLRMKKESKAIKYPYPDESANHTLILSTTTLAVAEPEPDELECTTPAEGHGPVLASTVSEDPQTSNRRESPNVAARVEEYKTPLIVPAPTPHGGVTVSTMVTTGCKPNEAVSGSKSGWPDNTTANYASGPRETSEHFLHQGEDVLMQLENSPQLFGADHFNLVIDRSARRASSSSSRDATRWRTCSLTMLKVEEADRLLRESGSVVVDLDDVGNVTLSLDRCPAPIFFLRSGTCVIRVSLCGEDTPNLERKS